MADAPFPLARAVGLWLTLVAMESIRGVMQKRVDEKRKV